MNGKFLGTCCVPVEALGLNEDVKYVESMPVGVGGTLGVLVAVGSKKNVGLLLVPPEGSSAEPVQYKPILPEGSHDVIKLSLHKRFGAEEWILTVLFSNRVAVSYTLPSPPTDERGKLVNLVCDGIQSDVHCYGKNYINLSHACVVKTWDPTKIKHVAYIETGGEFDYI
jgi:hypothetical protein